MTPTILLAAMAAAQLGAANYTVDQPMPAPDRSRLLWSDEFDGPSLDMTKWSYDDSRNKAGWWNGEQQYYAANRPQNLRIEHGVLVIEARRDRDQISVRPDWGGQTYSSARITTHHKAGLTYGFWEVRAKLPCARGTWPAIWLLPENDDEWPNGGEIDVMEHVGSEPMVVHATLHTSLFNHAHGNPRGARRPLPSSCTEFHRYQLAWSPKAITVGVDDRAFMQVKNDQPGGHGAWPFDEPFHLILNLAVGGPWAGSKGIDDGAMPQRFEVDYVRVWALKAR